LHNVVRISSVIRETRSVTTLRFPLDVEAKPGQFVMVWVPGVDEVPMSFSYLEKTKGITVHDYGEATSAICRMKPGERLGIRGPFGNSFDFSSNGIREILAVGGGTGMAPIATAAELAHSRGIKVTTAIGARTASELIFELRMKRASRVEAATDDGTAGYSGFVTDLAAELVKKSRFNLIITCGPEIMMKKILELGKKNKIPVQASVERFMKCGVGICDACAIGGKLVCKNGPVFKDTELAGTEFGVRRRDASGKKVPLG
jgi:dihydroorotate dehydrogenase electron transfer subunit